MAHRSRPRVRDIDEGEVSGDPGRGEEPVQAEAAYRQEHVIQGDSINVV